MCNRCGSARRRVRSRPALLCIQAGLNFPDTVVSRFGVVIGPEQPFQVRVEVAYPCDGLIKESEIAGSPFCMTERLLALIPRPAGFIANAIPRFGRLTIAYHEIPLPVQEFNRRIGRGRGFNVPPLVRHGNPVDGLTRISHEPTREIIINGYTDCFCTIYRNLSEYTLCNLSFKPPVRSRLREGAIAPLEKWGLIGVPSANRFEPG